MLKEEKKIGSSELIVISNDMDFLVLQRMIIPSKGD
jgi:hypothetical protein